MAQYNAEVFTEEAVADFLKIVDDTLRNVTPIKTYPCEPIKGVFLSYLEDLPEGSGVGGGSYVWGG